MNAREALLWKFKEGLHMSNELKELLEAARVRKYTEEEKEAHRRSFAFGNTNIENSRVTREIVDREAERLNQEASESEVGASGR